MMKRKPGTSRETAGETRGDLDHNPYVFIVGCSRSGTTLLQRLVDAHPLIAITSQTNWVTRYSEMKTGLTPEGLVTPEMIPRLIEYHRFPYLGIDREDLEGLITPGESVSYSNFVSGVFDLYGETRGKRLAGSKIPAWVRRIPTLHALWPEAEVRPPYPRWPRRVYVHLELEKANRKVGRFTMWTEDPLSTTALWWEWSVRLGREDGSSLEPGLYYEIRYESLISHPADECAALCTFLGLPYDDEMLRFHEGRERTEPGLDAKRAWQPVTSVSGTGGHRCLPEMSSALKQRPVIFSTNSVTLGPSTPILGGAQTRVEDPYLVRPRSSQAGEAGTGGLVVVNPFVFIVGCPKSGTTLLRRMVDAHPLVAIPNEQHWIPNGSSSGKA